MPIFYQALVTGQVKTEDLGGDTGRRVASAPVIVARGDDARLRRIAEATRLPGGGDDDDVGARRAIKAAEVGHGRKCSYSPLVGMLFNPRNECVVVRAVTAAPPVRGPGRYCVPHHRMLVYSCLRVITAVADVAGNVCLSLYRGSRRRDGGGELLGGGGGRGG